MKYLSPNAVDFENNWLGRSQFSRDPDFNGIIYEFRVYDAALSASQVWNSYSAGEDL